MYHATKASSPIVPPGSFICIFNVSVALLCPPSPRISSDLHGYFPLLCTDIQALKASCYSALFAVLRLQCSITPRVGSRALSSSMQRNRTARQMTGVCGGAAAVTLPPPPSTLTPTSPTPSLPFGAYTCPPSDAAQLEPAAAVYPEPRHSCIGMATEQR